MKYTNYTLPEWVFLDANSHEGNALEGRTVIRHIRSYTILEAVALDEVAASSFPGPKHEFAYTGPAGVTERHLLVLHFSLAAEHEQPAIFEAAADWYRAYLRWEDRGILNEARAGSN